MWTLCNVVLYWNDKNQIEWKSNRKKVESNGTFIRLARVECGLYSIRFDVSGALNWRVQEGRKQFFQEPGNRGRNVASSLSRFKEYISKGCLVSQKWSKLSALRNRQELLQFLRVIPEDVLEVHIDFRSKRQRGIWVNNFKNMTSKLHACIEGWADMKWLFSWDKGRGCNRNTKGLYLKVS